MQYIFLRNLWAIASKLSLDLKKQLVHCLIFSKLDYCNSILYNLPAYRIKRLQKVQNYCVRFLFGKKIKPFDRITPFFKESHFLPGNERIKYKIVLLVYKSMNKSVPDYLKQHLRIKCYLNHSLRNEEDFFLLKSASATYLFENYFQ